MQYNVRKEKNGTMVPLLLDKRIQDYDILAIQEPWRNPFMSTSYCPRGACFTLAYQEDPQTRVCFYIHKNLDPNSWEVEYISTDLSVLTLRQGGDLPTIRIYNAYSLSPSSQSSMTEPPTITALRTHLLENNEVSIVLGDFNLHHPHWGGELCRRPHAAASLLLDCMLQADLSLLSAPGEVTWEARGSQTAIDTVFASSWITERRIRCGTDPTLAQSSDHRPITTHLSFQVEHDNTRRRAWKRIDTTRFYQALERESPAIRNLLDETAIDCSTLEIIRAIQAAIEESVPWEAPSVYATPGWTTECSEAIRQTKRAQRTWQRTRDQADWIEYRRQAARKSKVIRNAKRDEFRTKVRDITKQPQGLWRLAKWARTKSGLPPELPQFPPIRNGDEMVTDFQAKADLLTEAFFPPQTPADLSDIIGEQAEEPLSPPPPLLGHAFEPTAIDTGHTPGPLNLPLLMGQAAEPSPNTTEPQGSRLELPYETTVTSDEVKAAIWKPRPNKAPGPDDIPNHILRLVEGKLNKQITHLFQACVNLAYHPRHFRVARTIALKKPGKPDYTQATAWRPIALLNSLGKALEAIQARRLTELAERHRLLPDEQHGCRAQHSTESALELLTEQIRTAWSEDKVVTVLSLDVQGAFDRVSHPRLLNNLRRKGIPESLVQWTKSFLTDRRTSLTLQSWTTNEFSVTTGIPQGSPISPILYLFFNAPLLEACRQQGANAVGFADDITLLACGNSTEENCETLSRLHVTCQRWAHTHGASFSPSKYQLMHLTRATRRYNLHVPLVLEERRIEPSTEIKILGLYVDPKMKWGAHIKKIKAKMTRQTMALSRITASTWGTGYSKGRLVYNAIIRPAITYAAPIWHTPMPQTGDPRNLLKPLDVVQNDCLRQVTGAYRATSIRHLEAEAVVPPLEAFITQQQIRTRAWLEATGRRDEIQEACHRIRERCTTTRRRRRAVRETPGEIKHRWARDQAWPEKSIARRPQPWRRVAETLQPNTMTKVELNRTMETALGRAWRASWVRHGGDPQEIPDRNLRQPFQKRLKLHEGLTKAQSSLAIQLRTRKIGLRQFLYDRHVPTVPSPACDCGWHSQTVDHILLYCPRYTRSRPRLLECAATRDLGTMLSTNQGLKAATTWMMELDILGQYQWARRFPDP